mmetsp:Transcript_14294/g.39404  ORF Transcript_14294/g.39404 Transcript_14294/m.39404 type:complete len:115 (-) Transcript_14294:341-685(-)
MSPNPIYPAKKAELEAMAPVFEVACVESRAVYEKEKMEQRDIKIADIVGRPFRSCAITSHFQILESCADLLEDVQKCNKNNEYDYGRKCISVRDALVKCAAQNKVGEFGKNFLA